MSLYQRASQALSQKAEAFTHIATDKHGYFTNLKDNFIPSADMELILPDYKQGSGNEADSKMKAAHSSAMLAANSFGIFKKLPEQLSLHNHKGFCSVDFEAKCPTGLHGIPPHLDVLLQDEHNVIGIESKLLEILTPKQPLFKDVYFKHDFIAEDVWLSAMEHYNGSSEMHFDVAQIIKHYLGLMNTYAKSKVSLMYVFWEPTNWMDFDEYHQHRKEIKAFIQLIATSKTEFTYCSYNELWQSWNSDPRLAEHLRYLRTRYEIMI